MLFFLVESGIPEPCVYGYHEGWDFDRLVRAFQYLKGREIEQRKWDLMAAAAGVSTIAGGKVFRKVSSQLDEALGSIRNAREESKRATANPENVAAEMSKLAGLVSGSGWGDG